MNQNSRKSWLAIAVSAVTVCGFAKAGQSTQLLPNPGFEEGETHWSLQDPASMSHVVAQATRTGTMGLRVTDEDDKRASSAFSAAVPTTGGQGLRVTFWAKTKTAEGSVALHFYDANKKNISEYQPLALIEKSDDWCQYQFVARAPIGTQSVKVGVHSNSGAKTVIDLDDVQLETINSPEVERMSLLVPSSAPAEVRVRKHPPYIILKLDDLVSTRDGRVHDRWQKLVDFLKERKVKAGIGIITQSLEDDKPKYFNWIRELRDSGSVEFWDHGYTHREWDENGQHFYEFKGRPYEEQKAHFVRSQVLAREKLGFPLAAFGPGFNVTDDNTLKAISEIPELKIWLYGDHLHSAVKTILHRNRVNIEYPTFSPNLEKFIAAYNLYPQDRYFVIQGHPAMWTEERFNQFRQIIDFLISQNAVFITPSEFVALSPGTVPNGVVPPVASVPTVPSVSSVPISTTPNAAQSLITNGDFSEPLQNGWKVRGKTVSEARIVDVKIEDTPFTKAVQVGLAARNGGQPWDVLLSADKTALPIAKNDLLLVQFWARSTPTTRVLVFFQQASTPFEKSIRQTAALRPQWQKYTFYAPARSAYAASGSIFEMGLGHATGNVEITGISVRNFGALSISEAKARFGPETFEYYGGSDHDDSWIPAAQARIEKYRKADLKLSVVAPNGKPIRDAQVVLKQTKSAFRWGTAAGPTLLEGTPDGEAYRAILKRLFNTATIENQLKWKADDNPTAKKQGADMLDWLNNNGFAVRGHTLVWGSERYLPYRLKNMSADETRAAVEQRVTDAVTFGKGKIYVWDVVNEAGTNTQLWDKIGWDAFADVYRRARLTDPRLLLAYNDYNISNEAPDNGALRQKVEARIEYLINAGVPLDILGDQAHIGVPLTTIPRVLQIWDEWGQKYKKPIEITEFDTNVADDEVHEKYVRDFLTGAFSNPNIESFVLWGFWAKTHFLGESGALFRADWSPRPAALTFEDLVLNKWRTNVTLKTDNAGIAQTRGFLGDYELSVTAGGKTTNVQLSLGKDGLQKKIILQ